MLIAAYAVFESKRPASISETFSHDLSSGGVTFCHVLARRFVVTWISPSSVPAQIVFTSLYDGATVNDAASGIVCMSLVR